MPASNAATTEGTEIRQNAFRKASTFRAVLQVILSLIVAGALYLFLHALIKPVQADPPPGIQEYFVLGYENHFYRMYKHGGVSNGSLPALDTGLGTAYMASIVDITVTADDQIIIYDHWEDGYEADIFNPGSGSSITGTLVLGDGNPDNGNAADFLAGRTDDQLLAGDAIPFSSREAYSITATSPITGYIAIDPRTANDIRFDGGDRIVSTGGPIGLVHAVWPVRRDSGQTFTNQTWIGDSWEIYSIQTLQDAFLYRTPIGEDLTGNQFANVDLQIQAFENNTTVIVDNGPISVTLQLDRGQTYFSGDGTGYIDNSPDPTLNVDVQVGTSIVADKAIQAGLVAYQNSSDGFQDRYYNMIPEHLWDKFYFMPTGDNPEGSGTTADGNSQVYIYNPNDFTISVTSADTAGPNSSFEVGPNSVINYQAATGAANLRDAIPALSGVSLSSEASFWAIHAADANPGNGVNYDWGNTFLPLFFLTDEYYASWAPGNVSVPPSNSGNGSPLWVTAIEDNTRVNVDYDNDDTVDELFLLDSLEVVMLRDDSDNDQSGTHIWTEDGQKLAVIWGEDAVEAGFSTPYLDVGHLVLPITQQWLNPVYDLEKNAFPDVIPEEGGTVTFSLKATAASFANVANLVLTDTLPISWTYISHSTVISYPDGSIGSFEPVISTETAALPGGQIAPQTVLFWDLSTDLAPEQAVELQFQAAISNPKGTIGSSHLDGFESNSYTGGIGPWLSNWIEVNESSPNNPSRGDIEVRGVSDGVVPYRGSYQLRIEDDQNRSIYREVDLSNFTRPVLRFKRNFHSLEDDETYGLDISVDGGGSYSPLLTWTYPGLAEDIWIQEEVDLVPYMANLARIRFRGISDISDDDDLLFIDEVEIYDDVVVNTNRASARGAYLGFDYVTQAQRNVYVNPFKIAKESSIKTASLGATVVFTLTYSNSSDTIVGTDFVINDTLPPGLIFAGASNDGEYITKTNTVSWTVGDILPNTEGSVVLITTLVDTIRPEDGEALENAANLINDEYFLRSNVVNLTALAPDLELTKFGPGSAHQGDTITYTIQYENRGSIPATNVVITDAIPANTTYVQDSCTGGCSTSPDAGTLTWSLGDVAPGVGGSLSFRARIAGTVPLGTNIQNVALVDHTALTDPEEAVINTHVSQARLDKAASLSLAAPGQTIAFTLTYRAITNITAYISDEIPANTSYITGSTSSQTGLITPLYSTDGVTYLASEPSPATGVTHLLWPVELISGTTSSVSFQVQVDTDLANNVTIQNQARLTATTLSPIYSNEIFIPTNKLSLEKLGPNLVEPGGTFTYTLRVGNSGSAAATITLSDTLPISTSFIAASPSPTLTDPLNWSFTLPANTHNVDYAVIVSVPDNIPLGAELRNTASLSSDQHAVSDIRLTYIAQPFVSIVPNNTGSGHQDESLCYGHVVFNSGTISDTINLTATHSLWSDPALTMYRDVNLNGSLEPGTDTLLVDTNADTIVDTGMIEADSLVNLLACLTIPGNTEDGGANVTTIQATSSIDADNFSQSTDTTSVQVSPGLSISKDHLAGNGGSIYPGDEITYTITITNLDSVAGAGYFTHTKLIVTDAAAADVSFVPGSGSLTPSGGAITVTTAALTATYPVLGLGQAVTVTLSARVGSTAAGPINNIAYADSEQQGTPVSAASAAALADGLATRKFAMDLNGPPVVVSDTIRYSIVVTNPSPTATQHNISIYDALPALVSIVTGSQTISPTGAVTYLVGPHAISATLPSLGPQQQATITFDTTIDPAAAGQPITNTALVSSSEQSDPPQPDPICPDGSAEPCPPVVSPTTLAVGKTAQDVNGTPLVVSDTIRYTLQVTNTGTYTAFDVTVTDDLPDGVTYVGASPDVGTSAGSDPVQWTIPELATNTVATLQITVMIKADQAGQAITNTGSVTGSNLSDPPSPPPVCPDGSPEPCGPNSRPVATTTLAIGKTAEDVNGAPLFEGDDILYTLQITNTGTYTAFDVTVTDDLPDEVTYVGASPDVGTSAGSDPVQWTIPELATNTVATLQITVTIKADQAGQAITNTGSVTGSNLSDPPSPPPVCPDGSPEPCGPNSRPVATTTLAIGKTAEDVNGAPLFEGDDILYTLQITNTGTYTAFDVTVTDDLPDKVILTSHSTDLDSVSGTDPLVWTILELPASTVATLYLTVTVEAGTSGQSITNTAMVSGTNLSPAPDPPDPVCPDGSRVVGGQCSIVPVPVVDFNSNTFSVGEAAGTSLITVTLATSSALTTTVNYATSNGSAVAGSDYITSIGTLTFDPGVTSQVFDVTVVDDSFDEIDETITLTLSSPQNAALGGNNPATLTIVDNDYSLVSHVVGNGTVLTNPLKTAYTFGEVVTLTATADPGSSFANWSGDLSGSTSPITLTMTAGKEVTATFTQDQYALQIATVGSGWVLTNPAQAAYDFGEVVTLTAFADFGWTFGGWSGDLTGSNSPDTVTITGDTAVTGTFIQEAYTLAITTVGGGAVVTEPAKVSYSYGEVVTLTATADPGWTFGGWSGDLTGSNSPDTVTITGDMAITGTFTQEAYTLAITTVGGGAVVTEPAKVSYSYGEVVTLTATADPGWTFAGWSGDLSGSNPTDTITITGDTAITGTFTQEAYTLAITTVGGGAVVTEPAKVSYSYGEVVTLTATADPGWMFGGWSGDLAGSSSPDTVTITGDTTITGTFTQEAYTLAITTVGGGTVVTEPAKVSYSYGEVVTLTATADPGWTFAGWSGDLSGLTSPETISMTSARTITATFSAGSTVLELSKTALDIDGPPLFVTDTIRYTIQVTNSGSIGITALNVVVTDTMPVSVTLVSSDASQGTTSGTGQLVWDVGDLPAGGGLATMVVTVTLLVGTEDQSIINYVTVGADNANSSTIEVCPDSGTPSDGVCAARPQVPDQAEQEGVYIPIVIK